jgi:hypothetical protein
VKLSKKQDLLRGKIGMYPKEELIGLYKRKIAVTVPARHSRGYEIHFFTFVVAVADVISFKEDVQCGRQHRATMPLARAMRYTATAIACS